MGRDPQINDSLYQVWLTSYPLDGSDPASKYDKGYRLYGGFNTLDEAIQAMYDQSTYEPILTRLVTWKTTHTEVNEHNSKDPEASND